MQKKLVVAVVLMGFSGIIAEIVLLRELMVAFHGNELSIGVVLANWLILESAGAYLLGKKISEAKNKLGWFILVTVLFSVFFLASIYGVRTFREFTGALPGEGLGIVSMFAISFVLLLPVSLLHGALFTSSCNLYAIFTGAGQAPHPENNNEGASSIARVYILETFGTIAGGLILTYLFIPWLHSVQTALVVALANLLICGLLILSPGIFSASWQTKAAGIFVWLLVPLTLFLLTGPGADRIHRFSVERQWKNQEVLHYQNTPYGNIVVTQREQEYTFFSDGLPVITTPNPDLVYVEEFVHFPMLAHPDPGRVLVLSGGAGGVIHEILKHPVISVDYTEVDPAIPAVIEKFPTSLTEKELRDPRVTIREQDARFYLKRTQKKHDVILSGFTDPNTLQANRFFTKEFFSITLEKLNPEGIFILGLPGSLTYLSPELADLNLMVLNTLEQVFPYVRVIPGDGKNFFLASPSPEAIKTGHEQMTRRIMERELSLKLVTGDYLEYRLQQRWSEWFFEQLEKNKRGPEQINRDYKPLGVFYSLVYWNEMFSPGFNRVFKLGEKVSVGYIALLLMLFLLIFLAGSSRMNRPLKPALSWCIFSTGFAGMLFDLMLIFAFQVIFGYIFYWLGLLVTAFMGGVMAGGWWMSLHLKKRKSALPALLKAEYALIIFALLLPWIFIWSGNLLVYAWFDYLLRAIFLLLSFVSGMLVGVEFPLANKEYLGLSPRLSGTAGWLYSADLLGGWLGGMLGAVVLLPVMGLVETAMVIILVKLSSIIMLMNGRRKSQVIPSDAP